MEVALTRTDGVSGSESTPLLLFWKETDFSTGTLVPYVYQLGLQPHVNGTPVMRSMFVEFPDDPACRTLDRQYMFGPSMLVAPPVFTYSGEVSYRFRCGCAMAA